MCVTLFFEVISALVRRGSWRQRANLTVLISLVRFINKLQRHEVELEKCVTSIHSAPFVCIWDCFSRLAGQREPIHSTFGPAVWWLRWMGLWSMSRAQGGGAAGRAHRGPRSWKERKRICCLPTRLPLCSEPASPPPSCCFHIHCCRSLKALTSHVSSLKGLLSRWL